MTLGMAAPTGWSTKTSLQLREGPPLNSIQTFMVSTSTGKRKKKSGLQNMNSTDPDNPTSTAMSFKCVVLAEMSTAIGWIAQNMNLSDTVVYEQMPNAPHQPQLLV